MLLYNAGRLRPEQSQCAPADSPSSTVSTWMVSLGSRSAYTGAAPPPKSTLVVMDILTGVLEPGVTGIVLYGLER